MNNSNEAPPTPGSAEGTENPNAQSAPPVAPHTSGSAEGEDIPAETGEGDAGDEPRKGQ